MEKEDQNLQPKFKKTPSENSIDKNIEIAQALNQEELDNISNSPNLESLPPDENIEENQGAPTEQTQLINEQTNLEQQEEQVINAEDLEGFSDNASPQEGESNIASEENPILDNLPPEDQTISGSPSL